MASPRTAWPVRSTTLALFRKAIQRDTVIIERGLPWSLLGQLRYLNTPYILYLTTTYRLHYMTTATLFPKASWRSFGCRVEAAARSSTMTSTMLSQITQQPSLTHSTFIHMAFTTSKILREALVVTNKRNIHGRKGERENVKAIYICSRKVVSVEDFQLFFTAVEILTELWRCLRWW